MTGPGPSVGPELSRRGRRWRIAVTILLVGSTFAGTAWGLDDDFPFAPFRMYARSRNLDSPVNDTWAWAIDVEGRDFRLSQAKTGIRRAEVEGQLGRFQEDPSRMEVLVEAFEALNPHAPRIVRVEIRTRRIEMSGGVPTGDEHVNVRAEWDR